VALLPMFADEVVGISRLQDVAEALYHGADPTQFYVQKPPYAFTKDGAAYTLVLHVPFVHKEEITMTRQQEDVVVRIGSFKRHVPLPRAIARLKTAGAKLEGDRLVIRFVEEGRA
jgi:arsenite-transporting ATPase